MKRDPAQRLANVVEVAEETMTEAIPEAYSITSGFLQAGVMSATAEASSAPTNGGRKKNRNKGRGKGASSTSATSGSKYEPVSVPAEKELS